MLHAENEYYRFLFFVARVILGPAGGLPRLLPGFDRCLVAFGDAERAA